MRTKKILLLFLWLMQAHFIGAQLCQGSLGDPIVNITFGSGANPGPPLAAATTSYQYVGTDCPGDGFYTVRNKTNGCFFSTWHSLNADHTGNINGYFMLVNASFQPSAFYIDTVNVLCSNTTYEFAAWVLNTGTPFPCSGAPIRPNLTFNIEKTDGTILQTYNSGNIPPQVQPQWIQYGFFFATPANESRIVLRIINNAQGGCGNDLALDDITFRPCGPLVNATINGIGSVKEICEGETAQLTFSSTVSAGYISPYLQWQQSVDNGTTWTDIPGSNTLNLIRNILSSTAAGTYLYRQTVSKIENFSIAACRINSEVLKVVVNSNPVISLTGNAPFCEKKSITLEASGGAGYSWSGVNGFTASNETINIPDAQFSNSGKYYVEVTTAAGCKKKDSIFVDVNPSPVATVNASLVDICEDDITFLHGTGGGSYLWSPATALSSSVIADPIAAPKDSIRYSVEVSNSFGCRDTTFVQINVSKKPRADAGPDKSILEGQATNLLGTVAGSNISYYWAPTDYINDINLLGPKVNPIGDKAYVLNVMSNVGCGSATDEVVVHVYKAIYVPNAFSPNQDGLNDRWKIPALNAVTEFEIAVYNRYGQVVFKSKNNNNGWDGSFNGMPQPSGVYCYIIKVNQLSLTLSGWLMIVK